MTNHPVLSEVPDRSNDRDYDIFEEFPDGSTAWRACIFGRLNVELKLREFAENSKNNFFALNLDDRDRVAIRPRMAAKKLTEESGNPV